MVRVKNSDTLKLVWNCSLTPTGENAHGKGRKEKVRVPFHRSKRCEKNMRRSLKKWRS
mgnify:CR=1 FL=1